MKKIYQKPFTETVHVEIGHALLEGSPLRTADFTQNSDGATPNNSTPIEVGDDDPTDVDPARGFSFSWEDDWE